MMTELACPDGRYGKTYDKPLIRNNWRMMWQSVYIGMLFHWNAEADYGKVCEEINSLYYGKGWEGGMREFRKYLTELYMNAAGCWGYQHSVPVGKFLDVPGAREKLEKLLDAAEKAAASDPDKRALAHVRQDRTFFRETWVKAYQDYISNFREINAYPLHGKITIDGRLDEADWRNADVVTRFKRIDNGKTAEYQTSVKTAYDKDNIYFGIECLEPDPGKLVTKVQTHDGPVWEDNDIELFINDPILGETYFQIMFNASGVVCDGSVAPGKRIETSFESNAEVRTSIGSDRWFMEIRVPVKSITGGRLNGGEVLKMNVMRVRRVKDAPAEASTWSSGTPHGVEAFHAVTFAPRRKAEGNPRLWKNGSFNEIAKKARIPKNWKLSSGEIPANWTFSSAYPGEFEYPLHPGSSNNRYVRISGGFIASPCGITSEKIAATCSLRGRGTLRFSAIRYRKLPGGKLQFVRTELIHAVKIDSEQWKKFSFTFNRPGKSDETFSVILWPEGKDVMIDIDDFYLVPR